MQKLNLKDQALHNFAQAVRIGTKQQRARAFCLIGSIYDSEGDHQRAVKYYLMARLRDSKVYHAFRRQNHRK